MIRLKGIGHVNLRLADQEVSKRFYRDVLGFLIAEEDPDHGGVFMTLGENFHTLEIYYELPHALQLFPDGRTDQDEALSVGGSDDPLPQWLLEDWPGPEMRERIERLRHQKEGAPA